MSLLTKEQLKEIERLRAKLPGIESNVLAAQIGSLLPIIDDLQARTLIPLREAEVEKLWENQRYTGSNNSYLYFHELARHGLLNPDAVREFIGALKAEP